MRNDGRDNLLGALLIAGQFVIPEVRRRRRVAHADRWVMSACEREMFPESPGRERK